MRTFESHSGYIESIGTSADDTVRIWEFEYEFVSVQLLDTGKLIFKIACAMTGPS
jgi:hypothetical protein